MHSGEGLGDPACVPWVSLARDVQPDDAVGVGGCAGSIRARPGLGFTFWVWFGLDGAPGVVLGGDPWPGLCIGRESLNASRAGDRLENLQPGLWQRWAPIGGPAGQGWLGHSCARAGWPLPAASTSPGAVSRQMLPWSSTSDPLSPTSFLLFSFQAFPPIEHLSWKPTSNFFFFFLSWKC